MANLLSTSITGTLNVSSTVTAPTFVGALSGNATSATSATTATNLGADYTADDWFRATGDNNHVKFYGNSRSIIYRTDGVTNEHGGGGYPHIWYYGGSADGNRVMIINTSGQLWMGNYGWLHDYFAPISHTHSYLPLSGGDLTGSVSVPNGSAVYFNGTGDTNWRIGRNIVTETGNFLTSNTIQFIAPNASGQGWQFVSSDNKTILEFGAYTVNYDGLRYSQGPLWLSDTARLHPIRKRLTAGTSPNNVKIADTSLAAYSANGNPNTYIIIRTAIPQDDYQMGGFTIDLFARYGDTNGKTKIDLGGYWNPESNSGFTGWEAHGTNPQLKPTIQVAREITSGFTCFILSGITWDYPVVVARDLYLGYNSAEGASYGHNWLIYSAANTNDHTNLDTVVWRNAYSDSNPSGFTTNTGTVTSVSGTGSYGGLSLSGTVTGSGNITLGGTPSGTWPISISGNAATATSATSATTAGRAYPLRSDGTNIAFIWSGQSGQPTWLFGSNNGTDIYVWNPSNFSVSYATSAGSATSATNADTVDSLHASSFFRRDTTNDVDVRFAAADGRGMRFWDSDNYKIWMSAATNATWGGRVPGETTSDYNMYFRMTGGTNRGFVFQNSTTEVGGIDGGGNFRCIGDAIIYSSSDARLKRNIKPIQNALQKVTQISGVEFDWDEVAQDTHKGHDVGVIAQEIEVVLPEIVHTRDNGYKAVKYEKLVALLIESVKELQAEVESLKAQINK